jgi:hypothetical protein
MEITRRNLENRLTASTYSLAAEYKYQGLDKYKAWDKYIQDKALKPEVDAKDFYAVFERCVAHPIDQVQRINFTATHIDKFLGITCQITKDDFGVFNMLWEDGHTGSYPPFHEPESERYVKI